MASLDSGDTAFLMTSTAFVLFMTMPGLALFYGGLVRADTVLTVVVQCFSICCIASLAWFFVGYSLAFSTEGGPVNPIIGGVDKAFLWGITPETMSGTIPETVFFMFQMTFAIITPALMTGSYPERVKFEMCLVFSTLWLLIIYVPVCHWVWGGGWLQEMGVMDSAGGIVVHATAGIGGLVVAWYVGPRIGFPDKLKAPHSPVLTATGAAMLWVGWFGFNAGSALTAGTGAGMAMTVTHLSAASAACAWAGAEWLQTGHPTAVGIVSGMVAGLASVTPASGFIGPMGGVILGLIAGFLCESAALMVKRTMKIDDSLDCFGVHGVGGVIGTLCSPLLAMPYFQGYGNDGTVADHLKVQLIAVVAVAVWTCCGTYLILKLLDLFGGMRVSQASEAKGLDMFAHGEFGYSVLGEDNGHNGLNGNGKSDKIYDKISNGDINSA